MSGLTRFMDRKLYPKLGDNWDNKIFREWLLERITPESCCLDYGAGRGNVAEMNFKGIARSVAGIDPEEDVLSNPYLDEAKLLDLSTNVIPYDDATFDVVYSNCVMEHVQNPETVLKEAYRVLKPGGVFLIKTPNKLHYVPMIASVTPDAFHTFWNKVRGRREVDTFPTLYRFNGRKAIRRHAEQAGFEVKRIELIEGRPEYLRVTAFTYVFGFAYERIVNSTDLFSPLRCVIITELQKPAEPMQDAEQES